MENLLNLYKERLKFIQECKKQGNRETDWLEYEGYVKGIRDAVKLLGNKEWLEKLDKIEKEIDNSSNEKIENVLPIGLICTEVEKNFCRCGKFLLGRKWHSPGAYECDACGNKAWEKVNSKYTWKKLKDVMEIVKDEETKELKIVKMRMKYRIDWENEVFETKENIETLILDMNNKEFLYEKDGERIKASKEKLVNFFKSY